MLHVLLYSYSYILGVYCGIFAYCILAVPYVGPPAETNLEDALSGTTTTIATPTSVGKSRCNPLLHDLDQLTNCLSLFGALKVVSAGYTTGNCVAPMPSTPPLAPPQGDSRSLRVSVASAQLLRPSFSVHCCCRAKDGAAASLRNTGTRFTT